MEKTADLGRRCVRHIVQFTGGCLGREITGIAFFGVGAGGGDRRSNAEGSAIESRKILPIPFLAQEPKIRAPRT